MASWLSPKYLRIQVSRSPGVHVRVVGAIAQEFDDLRQEGDGRSDTICLPQVYGILHRADSVRNLPLQESEVQAPFSYAITDGLECRRI